MIRELKKAEVVKIKRLDRESCREAVLFNEYYQTLIV